MRLFRAFPILLLTACGGETGPDDITDTVASVSVSPSATSVDVGASVQLNATVRNQAGQPIVRSVTWGSSPQGRVSVSHAGLVTGLSAGEATVTASAGGRSGTATVTVVDPTPPAAPSGVQAAPLSNTTAQVSWTDQSNNEAEFVVQREPTGGAASPGGPGPQRVYSEAGRVGANTTTFQDQGLAPATGYRYRVLACNAQGCSQPAGGSGSSQITTFPTLVIQTGSLPGAALNAAYTQQLVASSGGVAWSLAGGELPPGLTLSQDGVISGTPTTEGTFDFTVRATGLGQTPTRALSITVTSALAITTASTLPTGITGQFYSTQLAAVGGSGSYLWNVVLPGGLPSGFSLGPSTGVISGTPSSPSNSTFTIQVSGGGETATKQFTILIFDPLAITNTSLVVGQVGQVYSQALQASGGSGTNTWSVAAGTLPPGVTFGTVNNNGSFGGTPTVAGSYGLTIQVTSSDGQVATRSYTLTITN